MTLLITWYKDHINPPHRFEHLDAEFSGAHFRCILSVWVSQITAGCLQPNWSCGLNTDHRAGGNQSAVNVNGGQPPANKDPSVAQSTRWNIPGLSELLMVEQPLSKTVNPPKADGESGDKAPTTESISCQALGSILLWLGRLTERKNKIKGSHLSLYFNYFHISSCLLPAVLSPH